MTVKAVRSDGNKWVYGVKLHGCFTAFRTAIDRAVVAYPGLPFNGCPAFLRGGSAGSQNGDWSSAVAVHD